MEPVFMILAQSAATAACFAIDEGTSVQQVDYKVLKAQLESDGQILNYTDPNSNLLSLKQAGKNAIVVDDTAATLTGYWKKSSLLAGVHLGYLHDGAAADGKSKAVFSAKLDPGSYDVEIAYTTNANRATNVPITIEHADGTAKITLNQKIVHQPKRLFSTVGKFRFQKSGKVTITNLNTDGHVIIDAVRWIPQ